MNTKSETIELACTLNKTEFRERRALARKEIIPKVDSYSRTDGGLKINFSNSTKTYSSVQEFVRLEQGCCGFLNFELSTMSDAKDGLISLFISGPDGSSKFIDMFLQLMEENKNV